MTPTTLVPRPPRPSPDRASRRWSGVVFGLLVGLAVVCHGCHLGDHDDELSANGRQKPAVRAGGVGDGQAPSPTLPAPR